MTAIPEDGSDVLEALHALDRPLHLAQNNGRLALSAGAASYFVPAVRPASLGDASFRADHGSALRLSQWGHGQRHRLGRHRRGDGAGRHAWLLRGGWIVAGPRRGGCRSPVPLGSGPAARVQPDSQPQRAGTGAGRRRSVSAPRRPPGGGVSISRLDAAGGAIPHGRAFISAAAESSPPTGSSPRCRASRWRRASSRRRRSDSSTNWCVRAASPPSKRPWRTSCRWPRT